MRSVKRDRFGVVGNMLKVAPRAVLVVAVAVVVTAGPVKATMAAPGDINWTQVGASLDWTSVATSADGTGLVAVDYDGTEGSGGYLYTSRDGGVTWAERTSAGSRYWNYAASSADGNNLLAGVDGGYLYTSTDSGATWTERTSAGSHYWRSGASSDDGTKLVALANDGPIYTSGDGGMTWTERTSAGSRNWRSVASSADGTKLLVGVGGSGFLYTSTDSGATWTERTSAGSRNWNSVASSADGLKLAATAGNNYIYTSTDGGATWTERTSAGSRYWYSATSSADGTRLAVVDGSGSGYLYTSNDGGITWTERTSAGLRNWYSVVSSDDGARLISAAWSDHLYRGVVEGASTTTAGLSQTTSSTGQTINAATLDASAGTCAYLDSSTMSGLTSSGVTTPNSDVTLLGGIGYNLNCLTNGGSATVDITLGTTFTDPSKLRIYKANGSVLQDVTGTVAIANKTVGAEMKTVVTYTLTDGSSFDEDATANGTIVDPIYFGVVNAASTTAPTTGGLANTGTNIWIAIALALAAVTASVVTIATATRRRTQITFRR